MKARFLALAALVLGLASCQTEHESLNVNVGGEVDTFVTVTIPETETRANSAEGAIKNLVGSDDYTIRYVFEVYYGETGVQKQVLYSDGKNVSFPVRLVPGRDYNFVAWADIVAQPTSEKMNKALAYEGNTTDVHYNTTNLQAISLLGEWKAMDETRDAYSGFYNTKDGEKYTGSSSINIRMTRPFAKLRVITTDMVELTNLGITPTSATVKYNTNTNHYQSFNAVAGKVVDTSKTIVEKTHTFNYANVTTYEYTDANKVLFTDYFFAADQDEVVNFTLAVYDQNGVIIGKETNFNTPIPARRNYLTTISGNILTDGNKIEVTVNDAFENVDNNGNTTNPNYDYKTISSVAELLTAIDANNGEYILISNLDVNGVTTSALAATRAAGNGTTINLNGYTITLKTNITIAQGKTLTINDINENGRIGAIINDGGKILNNGTLNIEGGNVNDNVIENGENGMLVVDGAVATQAALNEAVKVEGATVKVKFGYYTFPTDIAERVTIEAYTSEDGYVDYVEFQGKSNFNIKGNTVRRVNFWNNQDRVNAGYGSIINANFEECTFTGVLGIYEAWAGETCNFKKCTFCAPTYACNFSGDSPKNRAYFDECTFMGWNSFGVDATFNNCVFDSEKGGIYNVARVYGNTEFNECEFVYGKLENKNNERIDLMNGSVVSISNCSATNNGVDANIFDYINAADGAKLVVHINSNEQQDLLNAAANVEGTTVKVKFGYYTFPTDIAEGVTIEAYTWEDGYVDYVEFQGKSNFDINGATVRGVNFWNGQDRVNAGYGSIINANFENCTFTGQLGIYEAWAGETCNFKKCTFCAPVYSCNFSGDSPKNTVYFDECTFIGWSSFGVDVSFDKCVFDSEEGGIYNIVRVYGETEFKECNFVYGKIKDEAVCLDSIKSGKTVEFTGCYVTNATDANDNITKHFANYNYGNTVIIDGTQYTFEAKGVLKVGDNTYQISNASGLSYFSNKTVADGTVIELVADIDLNGAEFKAIAAGYGKSFTFNGNNHTIKNVKLVTSSHNSVGAASLFFCFPGGTINISDLVIENATSEGATYVGTILGYTQGNATLKNITVKDSNISGVKKIGGLVGFVEASTTSFIAENCHIVNTKVEATEKQAGTILGYNAKPATLKGCTVDTLSTATAPAYCDGGVRCTDPAQAALTIE